MQRHTAVAGGCAEIRDEFRVLAVSSSVQSHVGSL